MKNFLKNSWVISIGSGLILLLITIIVDLITAEQIFSTIKVFFSFVWKNLLRFLDYNLKIWWVLIGIFIIIIVCYLYSKIINFQNPVFFDYTKDNILGYQWKWYWRKNYFGKYEIENLHPICDNCETPLDREFGNGYPHLKCFRCGKTYFNELPDIDRIKMLISDNVRRKYFPNE